MTGPDHRWADDRIEKLLGRLLQTGVILSALVVVIGGVLHLIAEGTSLPGLDTFHGEPGALSTLSGILAGAAGLQGRALIQLGILMLIATPVARVVFSLAAFVIQRDWMYAAFTLIVLALLLFSLLAAA